MKILNVAFVWNQHQPFYRDTVRNQYIMPWTRLHGSKDYYALAALLEQFPTIRQTFNLTPSLLKQLEDYLSGSKDYYQQVDRPVTDLNLDEKRFLLQHYFDIQWDRVIKQHPRYARLLEKQGYTREPAAVAHALEKFHEQDYRDLQVWFNLVWIDPEVRRADDFLAGLELKGEGFSETERRRVIESQLALLSKIVPIHRRLQEKGQIEIITTPFYHPLLPLIMDNYSALRASPGLPLPRRYQYPEDAREQMKLSQEQYRRLFGREPRGVWPPEQAVCPEMIPLCTDLGFSWTISDEQILARSLGVEIIRDAYGHVLNGDILYRPYLVGGGGGEMAMVFRDHHLSDRIGFEYQHFRPEDAAADLVHRLHRIRENLEWSSAAHLVTISLDGENAWEWYSGDKGPFLRDLYRRLSGEKMLRCVTVSEYLAEHPPCRRIRDLFTGSWVDHSLNRWIGTENKNVLWNLLLEAREAVERYRLGPAPDQVKLDRALNNLYIAEGSDYPWWIDSMPYYLAAPFENLFRKHLVNVFRSLEWAVPPRFASPLISPQPGEVAWEHDPLTGPVSMIQANETN